VQLVSIVGARPQFVKLAPFVRAVECRVRNGRRDLEHMIVHTGQHYDEAMSNSFFHDLDLPVAQFNLGVGSETHGKQTGLMMAGIEQVLLAVRPQAVAVYGDTNSTLAGALAAAKLHIPVAHVEAGLRSFRREMPEEVNRVVADHVCDLLLAPTATAVRNLKSEGLGDRARLCGDLMFDAVLHYRDLAGTRSSIGRALAIENAVFAIATLHRAENTDDPDRLRALLAALNQVAAGGTKVVFPLHPRTRHRIADSMASWRADPNLVLVEPVGYLDMLWLLDHACVALTDSGGVQREAFFMGCPCVTLRNETEWTETMTRRANVLADADPAAIQESFLTARRIDRQGKDAITRTAARTFGEGRAADAVLDSLLALANAGGNAPGATDPGRHVANTHH
jgi:UDP-N-acetylglucosamine 2-epimerase